MAKSFYIIDGHAQIFRAYFAPFRDLTSPSGEPTKATFVFTQMLINLLSQRKPDYLAMVIDSGDDHDVSQFRKQIYPQYKANRSSRPDDFLPQEQRILQIVKEAGIPIFAKPGYEADDVIATMATRLCDQGYDIVLVSKDKDLRQLLNNCTRMYDVQADSFTDPARMEADLGYTPREAVEVQTLMGDSIDNIPGIPGVGEKTAAKLIKKYGNADEVLKHLDELTPKLRENFEKHGGVLDLSRRLVTLKRDVEFDFTPEMCEFRGINTKAVGAVLGTLGFTTLAKRLDLVPSLELAQAKGNGQKVQRVGFSESLFGPLEGESTVGNGEEAPPVGPPPCTSEDCDYRLVDTEEKFAEFLRELRAQKRFAFDTETDALGAMNSNLIGMSFSWKAGTGYYVPVKGPEGCKLLDCNRVLDALRPILEGTLWKKVGHNIKYDMMVMRNAGIRLAGIELDTMIAAFLLDASRMQFGIDRLALDLLNFRKIATVELIGKGKNTVAMHRLGLEQVTRYAAEDADITWRLAELLRGKLDEYPALRKLNDELETPLIDVLAEMETNGVSIDPVMLKEQSKVLAERAEALHKQVMDAAGMEFNPDSPKQLADLLFGKLKLKVIKRGKTGPSTDVEVLEKLAALHPVPKLILEYRGLVKLKNTYLDNLQEYVNPKTKRVHGHFNQTGAATGRLSMSEPNLQNIPIRTDEGRRIRLAFVAGDAKENVLLTADYSQIELRVLAHYTEEPPLMRSFAEDQDIHATVASEVFGVPLDKVTKAQRGQAKTINFGIIYGVSAYGLARRIEGMSVQSAQDLIDAYNKRFPSIKRFMEKCVMDAQAQGYVETILGRRRRIPEIHSAVLAQRNAGERMAINSVIQGSAADLIKRAMVNIYRRAREEKWQSRMLLQVHDELVFETPKAVVEKESELIREQMTGAMTLKVPLKVDVGWGKNWQEGK